MLSFANLFEAMDEELSNHDEAHHDPARQNAGQVDGDGSILAIDRHMSSYARTENMNGFRRMQLCRQALDALDRRGWSRSFHQRLFHEEYLKSCTRVFFKRDGPGAFARAHNRILELNSWDATPQEILVSTPRRFGKTISVSMFAAAMLFSCPNMELSIYSTCKRISQKLLRNIVRFLEIIFAELNVQPYKFVRHNQEEVHVAGNEGQVEESPLYLFVCVVCYCTGVLRGLLQGDLRVINSYPSKIGILDPPSRAHSIYV
jgi:hypothetical protein